MYIHGIVERKLDYEIQDMLSSHDLATVDLQTSHLFSLFLLSKMQCAQESPGQLLKRRI